eukprot:1114551-Pleurochrysis_carterae.AAC.1
MRSSNVGWGKGSALRRGSMSWLWAAGKEGRRACSPLCAGSRRAPSRPAGLRRADKAQSEGTGFPGGEASLAGGNVQVGLRGELGIRRPCGGECMQAKAGSMRGKE